MYGCVTEVFKSFKKLLKTLKRRLSCSSEHLQDPFAPSIFKILNTDMEVNSCEPLRKQATSEAIRRIPKRNFRLS